MSASVDLSLVASLSDVSTQLHRYLSIVIFIFGTIGNVLNCCVLLQPGLRSNPCASFFLVSSIAHLIFIYSGLSTRMLAGWAVDLTCTIGWLCKFRNFVVFSSRTVALWLIVLATVDRWLSSSFNVGHRQMSTLKNAYRSIILIVLLSALLYGHIFYCYEANVINAPLKCYGKTALCRIITTMCDTCITVMMPIFLMMIFGVLTISNVRQSQRRIRTVPMVAMFSANSNTTTLTRTGQHQQRWKKIDRHLVVMLFFQVIVVTLLSLPFTIVELYSNLTALYYKSPVQIAIENFVFNFSLLIVHVCSGTPFYLYTLCGGSVFRNALLNVLKIVGRKMRCRHN